MERALQISDKVLGPEHPETATYLLHLILLLADEGDVAKARPLLRRAQTILPKNSTSNPNRNHLLIVNALAIGKITLLHNEKVLDRDIH
jgi:hypothetical protein